MDFSKIPLFKSPGCFVRVAVDFTIKNVKENRANNHPTLMTNNHRWRGASGSIRNRKIIEKIIQNRQKKIGSKPKTASKTVKTDEFSHTSYQNFSRSDIVVTSRAYRGLAAIQSQWLCIIAVQEGKN